jgi:AraC-like DNA-binding protein
MNQEIGKHTVIRPSAFLRPFIKRFEMTHSLVERMHTLLPDTSLVACFRLEGVASIGEASALPVAILSGLQPEARRVTHRAGSHVLLTVFTEAGAAAFFPEPLYNLFGRTTPLECLIQRSRWRDMHEQIREAKEHAGRVEILERFLLRELRSETPDPVAEIVASYILKRHGAVRMEELAQGTRMSLSALERRFRKNVGTSPRKFAKIVRMKNLKLRRPTGNWRPFTRKWATGSWGWVNLRPQSRPMPKH